MDTDPPSQSPKKKIGLIAGVGTALTIFTLLGKSFGVLPDFEKGFDWIKTKTDGDQAINTGSLGCVPETSPSAAYEILGDGPYSSRKQKFAVLAGNQICDPGWTGRVRSTPQAVNGSWNVIVDVQQRSILLRSNDDGWARVREGNRVRYRGRLIEFSEEEMIVVGESVLVEILPAKKNNASPTTTTPPKPLLEQLFGGPDN